MAGKLIIIGEQRRDRFLVRLSNRRIYLTYNSLFYLIVLAAGRLKGDGWVHRDAFQDIGGNEIRYVSRLKREIRSYGRRLCIDNDRHGHYRLEIEPKDIFFCHRLLSQNKDWRIRDIFENEKLPEMEVCA